jgi:F-type H+-transporting ATPase subunit beta
MAEYFRDINKQDVLLFIDNIFRFVQAGSSICFTLGVCHRWLPTYTLLLKWVVTRTPSTTDGSITSFKQYMYQQMT